MSHFSYRKEGQTVELSADYVVVGSGAGGAAAAVKLARNGASVIVVEAGPWRDPKDYPTTSYGALRDLMDDWSSTVTRGRAIWPVVQAKTVGGTTVINSAICVRTPADIFEQWKREHDFGGEALAERVWAIQDRIEEDLSVSIVSTGALGHHNNIATAADQKLGYQGHLIKRYAKGCVGSGQCLQGCRDLKKQSTNVTYIPEVVRLGGTVLSCAPVRKVTFQGNRATGVEGTFRHPRTRKKGDAFFVQARKTVIIAASVTHTPVLLRRSGIKNRSLGEYFRAHPGSGVFGCYDDPVDMNTGATQAWASTRFRDTPGTKLETLSLPLEMVASRLAGGGQMLMGRLQEYRHFAHWIHACRANTPGRITTGFNGKPVVHYTLDKADMIRFRAGIQLVSKLHFSAGAKAIIPGIYGMPYKLSRDQLHLLDDAPLDPRAYVAVLSHLFGGCVMGGDPKRSVCDPQGRVRDRESLVVADASVLPTNLGVNPQHTIMALAMLRAEELLDAA
jgi:choline dehydrogenase-like flavoprotein